MPSIWNVGSHLCAFERHLGGIDLPPHQLPPLTAGSPFGRGVLSGILMRSKNGFVIIAFSFANPQGPLVLIVTPGDPIVLEYGNPRTPWGRAIRSNSDQQ